MKKFWVFLIGFIFLGAVIIAQTPEKNFQKAGQTELAKRETILLQKKAKIEKFFNGMGDDGVISPKEMKLLKRMVEDFDKTQKKFNQELEFYKLETTTEILDIIRKHLDIYYGVGKKENRHFLNYADNSSQNIRRYFVERRGHNIVVEKSKDYGRRVFLALLTGVLASLILGVICVAVETEASALWIGTISIFVVAFILFLFLL